MSLGQVVSHPHGKSMPNLGQRFLALWQGSYCLVVNQEPVGVLDLEVVRVSRFKFDNATALRVREDLVESKLE